MNYDSSCLKNTFHNEKNTIMLAFKHRSVIIFTSEVNISQMQLVNNSFDWLRKSNYIPDLFTWNKSKFNSTDLFKKENYASKEL